MEKLIGFAFVFLVSLANFAISEQTVPQIKCLGIEQHYSNPEYNQAVVMYMTRKNDTYNNINLYWNLIKDFSADSIFTSKVYATDDTFQGGELILANTIAVCQPSEARKYLPPIFKVDKSLFGQSCIKKGVRKMKNIGQLRFELMIPDIKSKGKYFRADYFLYQGITPHFIASSYNELSE